jgi:hypothetical protein
MISYSFRHISASLYRHVLSCAAVSLGTLGHLTSLRREAIGAGDAHCIDQVGLRVLGCICRSQVQQNIKRNALSSDQVGL